MQPCDELKTIALQHYGKFITEDHADSVKDLYSLQEGVTIIGNDPDEWFEDRASIDAFVQEGSSTKLEIEVKNLAAYCEGSVGWTADRVAVRLPNGVEVPVRHTRIYHKEDGRWKMVHLHVSIAVPNESIGK